jgi:Spy/CpxP family protein refolding chaperone
MIRRLLIAAVLTTLLASITYAQRGGGGARGGGDQAGGGPGAARGPVNDKSAALTKEFKLTPVQQAALEATMDEAQKQISPILKQIMQQKDVLLQLCMDGKDTAAATTKLAELNAQGLAIEVAAFNTLVSKLDDKQKSKGLKLFDAITGMYGAPGGWRRSN